MTLPQLTEYLRSYVAAENEKAVRYVHFTLLLTFYMPTAITYARACVRVRARAYALQESNNFNSAFTYLQFCFPVTSLFSIITGFKEFVVYIRF